MLHYFLTVILYDRAVDQVINREERGTFRKEIVVTHGKVPLAMVRKRVEVNGGGTIAPVLLIHGFGQNRYTWHLPSRSLANHLAMQGFDVFNIDLRGHGRSRHLGSRHCRGIEDYVREDLPTALEEIQSLSGKRPVYLVGHSLGGLVSYAAAPNLAGSIGGLVSIGSPYHFARGSRPLSAVALFLRAMTAARIPLRNAPIPLTPIGAALCRLGRIAESRFYPIPIRGWSMNSCEPHILEQHLRLAFDRAGVREMLSMFEWAVEKKFGGPELDYTEQFEKMNVPLLVIAGSNDDLAPPKSVRPGFVRSGSQDKTYHSFPLGHIDLLVGRDAPLMTWPAVSNWITKRAA